MKKRGFTLAEVMIALTLTGLIAMLSLQAYKTVKSKFNFSCYYLYRDLKIAIGHMAADSIDGSLDSETCDIDNLSSENYEACIKDAVEGNTNSNIIDYKTDTGFCKMLAKYLSAASKVECADSDMNNATIAGDNFYGSLTKPNFRLLNKNYVYVSKRVAGSNTDGQLHTYRIVTFDLNGKTPPNTPEKDIISFAVFDNGEILPLGEPAVNPDFFIAVIKMRTTADRYSEDNEATLAKLKKSVRFPNACTYNPATKKQINFKEAYCTVVLQSVNYPQYCSGISYPTGNFIDTEISVQDYCVTQTSDIKTHEPECEYNIIKPQISKFFPVTRDVYSSVNNSDDVDEETGKANQIYKY